MMRIDWNEMKKNNFKTSKKEIFFSIFILSLKSIILMCFFVAMSDLAFPLGRRPKISKPEDELLRKPVPSVERELPREIDLKLLLVLHQECPDIFKSSSYNTQNPWIRLYTTRYLYAWGKAIERCSNIYAIVHLNTYFLEGINNFISNKKEDIYFILSKMPTKDLNEEDKDFILNNFFYIPKKTDVKFNESYRELKSLPRHAYTNQDFLDLVVLFNVAWMDNTLQTEVFYKNFRGKSRLFTEDEKNTILAKQMEIMKDIIPLYKELQDKKRIEIMVTPSHDSILPLVYNTDLAKVAGLDINLPQERFSFPEDVQLQLAKGLTVYETHFGCYPLGLWVPKRAITAELFPLIGSFGIKWLFVDEDTLRKSMPEEDLYKYYFIEKGKEIIVFPLHMQMSKKINNAYYSKGLEKGINELIEELDKIKDKVKKQRGRESALVALELSIDSDFIFELDNIFSKRSNMLTINYYEWFDKYAKMENVSTLDNNFIRSDFSSWIGKERQNRLWDYLFYTRKAVDKYKNSGEAKIKNLDESLEKIYIAEEENWFSMFGKEDSNLDLDIKQQEYNNILADVYKTIGYNVPAYLINTSTDAVGLADTDFILKVRDPIGDDNGCGDYQYPMDDVFIPGSFDLEEFYIKEDKDFFILSVKLYTIENTWKLPLGISFPVIDIYIDLNNKPGAGSTVLLPGRKAYTMPEDAWEYCVTINGEKQELYKVRVNFKPVKVADVKVKLNLDEKTVNAYIPKSFLRGDSKKWGFIPIVLGYDADALDSKGKIRTVKKEPSQWFFGGGKYDTKNPNIIDVILPLGKEQNDILGIYKKGRAVQIPALRSNQ